MAKILELFTTTNRYTGGRYLRRAPRGPSFVPPWGAGRLGSSRSDGRPGAAGSDEPRRPRPHPPTDPPAAASLEQE